MAQALTPFPPTTSRFWDYGNGLLLEAARARADVFKPGRAPPAEEGGEVNPSKDDFRYPSYVQDIMGDIFSLGFGPFRWCVAARRCAWRCARCCARHLSPTDLRPPHITSHNATTSNNLTTPHLTSPLA